MKHLAGIFTRCKTLGGQKRGDSFRALFPPRGERGVRSLDVCLFHVDAPTNYAADLTSRFIKRPEHAEALTMPGDDSVR